ncbi:MAG: hypothetical protein AAGA38_03625 [Pseudomonadota bacterium]
MVNEATREVAPQRELEGFAYLDTSSLVTFLENDFDLDAFLKAFKLTLVYSDTVLNEVYGFASQKMVFELLESERTLRLPMLDANELKTGTIQLQVESPLKRAEELKANEESGFSGIGLAFFFSQDDGWARE